MQYTYCNTHTHTHTHTHTQCMKVKVKSLSCVRLFATPWTVAYKAPPPMGFSRQEYWSGLPFSSPGDLPNPGIELGSPALHTDALPSEHTHTHTHTHIYIYIYTHIHIHAQLLQLCLTFCDPIDCSLPGFSVHGILQIRLLEWVAIPSSRGSSLPKDRTQASCVSCIDRRIFYR